MLPFSVGSVSVPHDQYVVQPGLPGLRKDKGLVPRAAPRRETLQLTNAWKYAFGKIGLLAMAFLLSGSAVLAETPVLGTFYVANSGSDSNSGTSSSAPWQTLAHLNALALAPGSTIYLQCGSVFRETLNIEYGGTSPAPINYGSYGSCSRSTLPIISGADLLTNWNTAQESGFSTYYAPEATAPAVVFENNRRLTESTTPPSTMPPGSFYYDAVAKLVYVRMINRDSPTLHVVEASVRPNAIVIEGVSYVSITEIEADKATLNDILAWGSLTNIYLTSTVTDYSYGNGIWFSASPGQTQNDVLIQNCVANYNGEDGIMKGNGGNNFIVEGCTADYNAFDTQYTYTGGIRFISDASGLNRATASGAIGNTAAYNGVDPLTGIALSNTSTGQQGTGVWCDTCGNGSFLKDNVAYGNAVNGVLLEFTGATGTLTMSGNIAYDNGWAGIIHSRSSHNDVVSNNTAYNNWYNCDFTGQFGGGDTTIGMVNNIYENNICASQVSGAHGTTFVAEFGAENNTLGQGSGNIYRNNSFGASSSATGFFAIYGAGVYMSRYSDLDAAYGSSMNSMQSDPMLTNPAVGNFTLETGSPALNAAYGGGYIGARQ